MYCVLEVAWRSHFNVSSNMYNCISHVYYSNAVSYETVYDNYM